MPDLRTAVADALANYPKAGWDTNLLDVAEEAWRSAHGSDASSTAEAVAIAEFRHMLSDSMAKTSEPTDPPDPIQIKRITDWVSQFAREDALHAKRVQSGVAQQTWQTKEDERVRSTHAAIDGQTVAMGDKFSVGGYKLRYPGEPVGPPSIWINCRCHAAPKEATVPESIVAAGTIQDGNTGGACVVALPHPDHPVYQSSSEDQPHMTLAWLGDAADIAPEHMAAIKDHVKTIAEGNSAVHADVQGRAKLGPQKADVQLLEGTDVNALHHHIMNGTDEDEPSPVAEQAARVKQHPNFTPHMTLGYPDSPAKKKPDWKGVDFDRLAVWNGKEKTEYPIAGAQKKSLTADGSITDALGLDPIDPSSIAGQDVGPDDINFMVPIPFYGVLAPEGMPAGDNRVFALGSLSTRPLPLPIQFQPTMLEGHAGAVAVGLIEKAWLDPTDNLYHFNGHFAMSNQYVPEVIAGMAEGIYHGLSIDYDDVQIDLAASDTSDDGASMPSVVYSKARIAGATIVPIPAFWQAFIALGDGPCQDCQDDAAPAVLTASGVPVADIRAKLDSAAIGTHDGPGWLTHPIDTERLRRYWEHGEGAAKIQWGIPGDFNRCRAELGKYVHRPEWLAGLCANMHKESIGLWPGQEDGGRELHRASLVASGAPVAPTMSLVASAAAYVYPADWFKDPKLTGETALTIDDDGRIYGHIAGWSTCHIGIPGECVTAPHSASNYAYFRTGLIETDEGDVPVGHLTMGTGHFDPSGRALAAASHYDNTGNVVADVAAGEDMYGIWVAGALRDDVTEAQRRDLKAAALSGDWRDFGRGLEMVAGLVVNVPGFPIPRNTQIGMHGDQQISLVASGVVQQPTEAERALDMNDVPGLVAAVADEIEYRKNRAARITRVRTIEASTLRPARAQLAKSRS